MINLKYGPFAPSIPPQFIEEILSDLCPAASIEPEMAKMVADMTCAFVDSTMRGAGSMATHRGSNTVELIDVEHHLHRRHGIRFKPLAPGAPINPYIHPAASAAHHDTVGPMLYGGGGGVLHSGGLSDRVSGSPATAALEALGKDRLKHLAAWKQQPPPQQRPLGIHDCTGFGADSGLLAAAFRSGGLPSSLPANRNVLLGGRLQPTAIHPEQHPGV